MLVFFWGNGAEDHLFKEKGKAANLVLAAWWRSADCWVLLPLVAVLQNTTPPSPRLVRLYYGEFVCKLHFTWPFGF